MGLPLSIDETFMSHIETDPGLSNAIMSLIQSGEIGLVTVSQAGIVTQSAVILADWAVPGAMVEENAPWRKKRNSVGLQCRKPFSNELWDESATREKCHS